MVTPQFQFACAESIDFLESSHWDRVVANSGVFLSRKYLRLLEQHLPEGLATHYALVFSGKRALAAVVAQSLDIRVADLPSLGASQGESGFWRGVGKASMRSLGRARNQMLLYDSLLLWPFHETCAPRAFKGELWPNVAVDCWRRFRHPLQVAEHWVASSVAWVHMKFIVCGSLLTTGPHGVAFATGEDPVSLWPGVLEALECIRRSCIPQDMPDMVMVKDLTKAQGEAEGALQRAGYYRFETEPDMVLSLRPTWKSFEDYLRDLKSSRRSEIRATVKGLDVSGILLERLSPAEVQGQASTIHDLYHQVHDRQKLRLVTLQEGWIPALAHAYPEDYRMVVARKRQDGQILGFITVLRDRDTAFGSWVGFDKTLAASGLPLYRSLVYAGVAQAIEMGVSRITLGRTALEPKAQIGAMPEVMYGYLRHQSAALNLAVPSVLALLPAPQTSPVRHPFKA